MLFRSLEDDGQILLRPRPDPGGAASFLLLACRTGQAEHWVRQAARDGVTLRRCWPAYQTIEGITASGELTWLAEHVLLLEIHPQLTVGEIERIARTLRRLATGRGSGCREPGGLRAIG